MSETWDYCWLASAWNAVAEHDGKESVLSKLLVKQGAKEMTMIATLLSAYRTYKSWGQDLKASRAFRSQQNSRSNTIIMSIYEINPHCREAQTASSTFLPSPLRQGRRSLSASASLCCQYIEKID